MAGILRGVTSFLPTTLLDNAIAPLYLLIDIFILFGLLSLYGFQHQKSGAWGSFGFLLAVIGLMLIRTGEMAGIALYPLGASMFTIGLSAFAVGTWRAGQLPKWISVCWLLSTILGFMGYFIPNLSALFVLSGVLFGVGFAGAGVQIITDRYFKETL
ncbi:hypothetical protein [Nodosilinea nodulosa]|uniref:hypothetical protein n=1 Tax=Nodosilinea nodulosa TaxID=416001 RepID=UPI001CED306C|nr:hypothetical protein [Nodosilinea nodulosa]